MSHQRYQPRSLMMPSRALRTSPPPPTSTIVPGRVRTAPNAHPVIPSASPSPTSHQRRRRLRAIVSRSLSRCSRSEEHTSELQSQFHLVCRLLLEKKKKMKNGDSDITGYGLHLRLRQSYRRVPVS